MVYSIQNSETGEHLYIHHDVSTIKQQVLDMETGEPLNGTQVKVRYGKHEHFQIPKKFLSDTNIEVKDKTHNLPCMRLKRECHRRRQLYKKEDFIKMDGVKNDIILGYEKERYLVFLILTFFCFSIGLYFLLVLIEEVLHYWAHKKNSLNTSKYYYFRSPLHVLSSQFCVVCRSEIEMKKIEIFQELNKQIVKAAKQSKTTLKDMSKVIS
uniref:Uncharacterized protein n=1 Tax=Ceratitis capitata TaxID=7213 RepID=W8C8X5_CERCA